MPDRSAAEPAIGVLSRIQAQFPEMSGTMQKIASFLLSILRRR